MILRLILKFVLYFPGTFAHELSHWVCALILGRTEDFSVIPRIEGENIVFGKVIASVRYKVFGLFIGAAPLIWWAVLYLFLRYLHILQIHISRPGVHFTFSFDRFPTFSMVDLFFVWLMAQLLWAGRLSLQDIKTCFGGIFSISGLILILVAWACYLIVVQQ